jgi:hypothetical protein
MVARGGTGRRCHGLPPWLASGISCLVNATRSGIGNPDVISASSAAM